MLTTTSERESHRHDVADGAEMIRDVLRRRAELTPYKRVFVWLKSGEREGASYILPSLIEKRGLSAASLRSRRDRQTRFVASSSGLEFVAGFFGCLYAGAVAVPSCASLLSMRHKDRLRFIVEDAGVEFILGASAESITAFRESHTTRIGFATEFACG